MAVRTGENGSTLVSMLTDNHDGTIDLRLHPGSSAGESVRLREPTARQYAELRVLMRDTDQRTQEECPEPAAPEFDESMPALQLAELVRVYENERDRWRQARRDLLLDPDKAPYAQVLMNVIEVLGDRRVTLDDLPVEAFHVATCSALLEVWETPLGGRDDPVPTPTTPAGGGAARPVPLVLATDDTEAASPAPAESSPPGTEPATPSSPTQ